MSLDNIKKETEQLKTIDVKTLSPEQLIQLVDKVADLLESSEKQLLEIKTENNEGW